MNQGIHSLVHFFVHSKWRRTTCCLLRKQQKFAVLQIILSHKFYPQTVVQSPAFASGFSVTSVLPVSNQLQPILNSLLAANSRKPDRLFSVPLAA